MSALSRVSVPRVALWRAMALALACIMAPALSASGAAGQDNVDIFGRWRVVSALDSADIAALTDAQARALVGKWVEISRESLRFQGRRCKTPTYARSERAPVAYLREKWHARSGKLGLPDPVLVVDARCTDLFLKSRRRMVFNWDGFFFEAIKE